MIGLRIVRAAVLAAPLLGLCGVSLPVAAEEARYSLSESGDVLMQADTLSYDSEARIVTAEGHVELAYGERLLIADKMTYFQDEGRVRADGHVALLEADGTVLFADEVELTEELKEGVINTLSVLLSDDSKLAALKARRQDGNVTTLYKGVFSPCDVCKEKGQTTPLWQIKAFRVTHDQKEKRIVYEDAFMELFGIPVVYMPVFSHPDPSVKRKSGFLMPSFKNSDDLGFQFEIPYFWAIAPNLDVTLAPRFTGNQGILYQGEFRHRIEQGTYKVSVTGTSPDNPEANTPADQNFRGSLFADGAFEFPDDWEAGFQVELTSDDTFLRRYDLTSKTDLITTAHVSRFKDRDRFSVRGYYFQGLLATDFEDTTPVVAPIVDYRHLFDFEPLGGQLRLDANTMVLSRRTGPDSRRLSTSLNWDLPHITSTGEIYRLFAELRGDVYHTNEVEDPYSPTPLGPELTGRVLPMVGAEWRWPFARQGGSTQQVLEPIVQLIYAPYGGNPIEIPNEDSLAFEFDDTNLFSPNRFPGLDRWEGGPRANVGVQFSIYGEDGGSASFLVGQSFRLKENKTFDESTGLSDQESDYVGRLTLQPSSNFFISHRFRFDHRDLQVRRNEVDAFARWGFLSGTVGYGFFAENLSQSLGRREEIYTSLNAQLDEYWRLFGSSRRDIEQDRTVQNRAGIGYADECFELSLAWQQDFTRDRDIKPSNSILLRIGFKHLGATGFEGSLGGN